MSKEEVWHDQTLESIFSTLETTEKGLSTKAACERTGRYGYNEIKKEKKDTALVILLRQFKSFVALILFFASLISFFMGHTLEFVVIIIIILISILLSFFMEYKASKDMDALLLLAPKKSFVMRDGQKKEVMFREVTIGDVIVLRRGDIVGADARLISANGLKVDESALTGESLPVDKIAGELKGDVSLSQQTNMVFAGTNITTGDGLALVVRIGEKTEIGKISAMIQGVKEQTTPLQKRLDKLTKQLSIAALIAAVVVFFIGYLHGSTIGVMFVFSMAVIVSGIPESLPTVVAVTLANGVKEMAKKNAIVKRLPSIETLGTCSVICSDKTGTLTQNKMVVENIFTSDVEVSVTGEGYDPSGIFLKEDVRIDPMKHKTLSRLLEIGILCNNSDIKKENESWVIDGEATEGALIALGRKAGISKPDIHKKIPRKKEHPFDPVRKCMSTVHVYKGNHLVYSKGAPEMLIKKAKFYLHEGKIMRLDKEATMRFIKKTDEYASRGLRVLGLAFKEHKGSLDLKNVENSLIFAGLVSIRDPPEPNAKESIKKCHEAGIKVVMITGDNELTARAIGAELGIFRKGELVVTGQMLEQMDDGQLGDIINSVTVFARVAPEHKLRIVKTFQDAGHIVAMTGDGVNDAPALKRADIGIAMGKSGTEVAKESSELILRDDNFTTITNAVEQGRTIYENLRKFIYFLLVQNFSEVLIVLIAVMVGVNLPLTALMVLFINLVTGQLPALGLSFEIMKQKPRDPQESILNEYLILKIWQVVPFVVLGTVMLYQWELVIKGGSVAKAQTIAFATIIFFELFHSFNARSWDKSLFTKKFFSNLYSIGCFLLVAFLTVLAIYLEPLQSIFGTVGLTGKEWMLILAVSSSVLLYIEIQKTLIEAEVKERKKLEIYPTRGV